ncbi:MAG: hypothetical protein LAN84_00225 [Acidobacteriia bacterium]|nr:hypothetical protein [Terriglobia bacterium]
MAYQTGTATSPIDLLQKLVTFLAAQGWNTDLSAADGAGWRAHLDLHGNFVHFRAAMNEGAGTIFQSMTGAGYGIAMYMSTAYNGAVAWNVQPGTPPYQSGSSVNVVGVGMPLLSGSIQNYYFFCDATGDNVVVVVEKTPGIYVYLGWGNSLQKFGTWTGGPYFFGTAQGYYTTLSTASNPSPGYVTSSYCPCGHGDWANFFPSQCAYFRVDVDTFTSKWIGLADQTTAPTGYTGKNAASQVFDLASVRAEIPYYGGSAVATQFQNRQTSALDSRANLLPLLIWAARDTSGYSPLGSIPNVFYSNGVGNGFSAASEYTIGPTTYKMFPNFAVVKQ